MEESVSRITKKFRFECVRHNDVVGRCVEFFVSDYGSNLFALKFTRAMKIKIMCEEENDCKDCHGPYDVSEVRDSTKEEKQETHPNSKPQTHPSTLQRWRNQMKSGIQPKSPRMPMICSKSLESF